MHAGRIASSLAITAGAVLLASGLAFGGAPFGGDDTGCVPDTKDQANCEVKVTKLFAKLIVSVIKCHVVQAQKAFVGAGSGEGGCEQSAKAKFDAQVGKLTNDGICPQAVLDNAATQEGVLLAGQGQTSPPSLDAFNGRFFCDSTSGALLADAPGDNDNDDAGWVPNDLPNLKCALGVAKNASKLWKGLMAKCHVKAAITGFKGGVFDEEGCENDLRAKYDVYAGKLLADGLCPSCLDAAGQGAIGDDIHARTDQENGLTFVCP